MTGRGRNLNWRSGWVVVVPLPGLKNTDFIEKNKKFISIFFVRLQCLSTK